tara:strand:- start:232 stop:453 length:222 start_codon:yes stop_codon:yes gene_type:complete
MTQIDNMTTDVIAQMLSQLNSKQLQQLITPNRKGSEFRAKRNARTEEYFARVKKEGLYPHNYDTFTQFREVLP